MPLPTRRQLINYLSRGRNHSRTAREVATHFGVSDGGVEVLIRNVIREAIQDGELIGSHSRGFYVIDDQTDFERYLRSLESRRRKIAQRINNLRKNWG
ncbi:MAG TPA: hypothetical protein VET23_09085 [Chitinophagaceae bacterium]|nr:hypothetical protein [Chitinophagaceae bacterium]